MQVLLYPAKTVEMRCSSGRRPDRKGTVSQHGFHCSFSMATFFSGLPWFSRAYSKQPLQACPPLQIMLQEVGLGERQAQGLRDYSPPGPFFLSGLFSSFSFFFFFTTWAFFFYICLFVLLSESAHQQCHS